MEEIWKPIKEHEASHLISNFGRIKSLSRKVKTTGKNFRITKEKILTLPLNSNRYYSTKLSKNGKQFRINRLVGSYFIPNPENKPCINHKDGNKLNNHVSNLEWCTHSENELHSYRNLKKIPNLKNLCNYSKSWENPVKIENINIRGETRKKIFKLLKSREMTIIDFLRQNISRKIVWSFIFDLKKAGIEIKSRYFSENKIVYKAWKITGRSRPPER